MGESQALSSSLIMKVMGLILLACLAPSMVAPAPTFDPITAASVTAAGGLVLTASSGATLTVPTAAILAGKAVAIKGLLLKTLANRAGRVEKGDWIYVQ